MERQMTTKDKIIYESLRLFSNKGYDGVSMREIAAAVGIKGASIYNHFSGKEEIFQAIFSEMKIKYDILAETLMIPTKENEETATFYETKNYEQLMFLTENLFLFYCKDEFAAMFRRLLTGEQHKSQIAGDMLRQYYLEAPIKFQTNIFESLQKAGILKAMDPAIMALHFYSPIYHTLCEYDLGCSYEVCLDKMKKHVKAFCEIYNK